MLSEITILAPQYSYMIILNNMCMEQTTRICSLSSECELIKTS